MTEPLLKAEGLSVRFGGLVALDALDLSVNPQEILGLLGPNGSGKTTFFNAITGIYTTSSGKVTFEGRDITGISPQAVYDHGITRTFQRSRLSLTLSVFDNVVLGKHRSLSHGLWFSIFQRARLHKEYTTALEQVRELLHAFNAKLGDRAFEPAGSLTMIDRRRVEICRALISEPRLLLLDEPSAGMTHDETSELMDDILKVREKLAPFSIVIIEHEMNVIQRLTQRCVVLNYGKKIADGDYAHVVSDPEVQVAYLGQE